MGSGLEGRGVDPVARSLGEFVGVAGPALAGVIGSALGWRWVFLGLLPLCGVIGLMAEPSRETT